MSSFRDFVLERAHLQLGSAKLMRANPATDAIRRLGWPPVLDGRGWPQQCSFDGTYFASLLLLVRVEKPSNEERQDESTDTATLCSPFKSALVSISISTGPSECPVALWVDGYIQSFVQMRNGKFLGMWKPVRNPNLAPSVEQVDTVSTSDWHVMTAVGPAAYTGARSWFQWSTNGCLVAFPAHWYGPEITRECLLVVDVETSNVVVAVTFSGECHFPSCTLAEWHSVQQTTSKSDTIPNRDHESTELNYDFDQMHTAFFSPDCSLLAVAPQGDCRTIIVIDCERKCELVCSRKVPAVDKMPVHCSSRVVAGGSVAFDPSSMQHGCASRLAFTMAENLCRSLNLRPSVAHSLCVYDMLQQCNLWQHDHDYCINEVKYNRYGDVLAATLCQRVGERAPWDVVLFNPKNGEALHRLALPGVRPFSHILLCSPLATHLAVFSYADSHHLDFSQQGLLFVTNVARMPTLQEFCRFAIHRCVSVQCKVEALPLPMALKSYLRQSLPCH